MGANYKDKTFYTQTAMQAWYGILKSSVVSTPSPLVMGDPPPLDWPTSLTPLTIVALMGNQHSVLRCSPHVFPGSSLVV